jgi:hypothetical protein
MFQGSSALIGNLSPYEVAMKARNAIEPIIS